MQLVFSDQAFPSSVVKSIFLAGPSPRRVDEPDWRHAALAVLADLGFDGTVFVPVPSYRFYHGVTDDKNAGWDYDNQITWECEARKRADINAFWVPRAINREKSDLGMPAFTTNFELGEDLHSNKVAYGRPADADKCRYLDLRVRDMGLPVHESLVDLFKDVIARLGDGALRTGGETCVPLFIWRSPAFQSWYTSQKAVGNRLDDATLLSSYVVGGKFLFSYQLKVKVWVAAESRHKSNEFIFSRPDVSSVIACHRDAGGSVHLALVREFRSPVNNDRGFVYELPGGSSVKPGIDPAINASHELEEEAGLRIEDVSRFRFVGSRQLVAPLSTHRAQAYAALLTAEEFAQLRKSAANGTVFGVAEDSERTYVEVATVDELFTLPVDYSTLGMVFEALRVLGVTA